MLREIEAIKKRVCIQFLYIITLVLSVYTFYYVHEGIRPLNYFVGASLIVHLFLIFIPQRLNYESLKSLIPIYLIYNSVFLYSDTLFYWHFGQITPFLWYSVIAIATTIFFERKAVIFWTVSLFIYVCSVFIVAPFIPKEYYCERPTDEQLFSINIMNIIVNLGLILFFIYYQNRINQIKESQLHKYEEEGKKDIKDTGNIKFENLYSDILNYFAEKRPYCNPDFTIVQLAKDINSNVKYISEVIKIKENINFNIFLNKYRISLIKEKIEMNYHNKYTLRHIYTTSGFRHQSTFNKAFRDLEGITPSEYIKSKKI